MNCNESKSVASTIAVAFFALLAGCASVPSADISAEVQNDLFSEAKTYNGGE
jgi:hypothetical protein